MKLRVLRVGRKSPTWADDAVSALGQRLRRYAAFDEVCIKTENHRGDVDLTRRAEAERLNRHIEARDRVVALDERGEGVSSVGFAQWLSRAQNDSVHRMCFIIGGPYGLDQQVRASAWRSLALSPMVLNHQIARVVLFEQLYRGHAILAGDPYHHA